MPHSEMATHTRGASYSRGDGIPRVTNVFDWKYVTIWVGGRQQKFSIRGLVYAWVSVRLPNECMADRVGYPKEALWWRPCAHIYSSFPWPWVGASVGSLWHAYDVDPFQPWPAVPILVRFWWCSSFVQDNFPCRRVFYVDVFF